MPPEAEVRVVEEPKAAEFVKYPAETMLPELSKHTSMVSSTSLPPVPCAQKDWADNSVELKINDTMDKKYFILYLIKAKQKIFLTSKELHGEDVLNHR